MSQQKEVHVQITKRLRGADGNVPYWDIFRQSQFVIGAQRESAAKLHLACLEANDWTHLDVYGTSFPNPLEFIEYVREQEWTFDVCSEIKTDPDGRSWFHGNIGEYSAAFRYLIFDAELLQAIAKAAPEVPFIHRRPH